MSSLHERFDALASTYPVQMRASLVVPLLQLVQEERGFLTEDDALAVADYAGVPATQVIEALSWYTMLFRRPVGRHVIKVCRNIACSLRGADRLLDHLQRTLGVEVGQTTADSRFTLLAVECLATCDTAPAVQVNESQHGCVSEADIDRILERLA
jgi:NADH-quinone oxidoreductase subunit E